MWKSILDSKGVLERGTRWRIGNGRSVSVWNDRWLLCYFFQCSFTRQEGNEVAHSFARYARTCSEFVVLLEEPPGWATEFLYLDLIDLN